MFYDMERCEHCGYVAWDLEGKIPQTDALKSILSEPIDFSNYVQIFERAAKIAELQGRSKDKVNWLHLIAAWAADDLHDDLNAISIRKSILANTDLDEITNPDQLVQLLDIARRASEKPTALKLLERLNQLPLSSLLKNIVSFQQKKLDENDTSCYTVEDAEKK